MSRHALLLPLLLLAACEAFAPEHAAPLTPPESYRAVWDSAQACTGLRGRFEDLRFFAVPGWEFDSPSGDAGGYTEGQTIYIASEYVYHPMVVRHEMIHALGVHDHPRVPFVDPCRATWESRDRTLPHLTADH